VSHMIGIAMGYVIFPCVFWIFYNAFSDLGIPTSEYPAPFATIYYNRAKLGVEGFSALPKGCLKLCYGFFVVSILINLTRDALDKKRSWFIPFPMAMAVPFFWVHRLLLICVLEASYSMYGRRKTKPMRMPLACRSFWFDLW
ncbi:probable metal-nicotianamine transporter YSL7, partial [Olea europaea subsp. europaea]